MNLEILKLVSFLDTVVTATNDSVMDRFMECAALLQIAFLSVYAISDGGKVTFKLQYLKYKDNKPGSLCFTQVSILHLK